MFRWGEVGLAILFGAAVSVSAEAQQSAASGQTAIGRADLSAFGNDAAVAAATACDSSALPGVIGGGRIKRYKLTLLYDLTEYNTGTCAANGKGSWTLNKQQKCGSAENCGDVTFGTLTGLHLGNGACPDHTYNFAAICYTWKQHNDHKVKDQIDATWHAPTLGDLPESFPIKVPIVYPTGDQTEGIGWDAQGAGEWKQTTYSTSDPKFDWTLNAIRESDPGTGNKSNDTCWCAGSKYAAFWQITGGTWYPDEKGVWDDYDHVGWYSGPIRYYRQKRRAPCGTTFPQQMQFQATNVSAGWKNYGPVNTLGGSFNYSYVFSTRAGKTIKHAFEPVPAKTRLACSGITWPITSPMTAENLGTNVTVTDPRPVAAAIEAIEQATHQRITYEDAPVRHKLQMMPMVRGFPNDERLLVPKTDSLRFKLPADVSGEQVVAALEKAVADYNASGRAARFAVLPGALVHVVPRDARDATGRLVPVTPVLDSKITLEAKPRTALQLLTEICQAVSVASGQPVDLGTVPFNALRGTQVEIGAENEPARDVLIRVIVATGLKLSWALFYDPGTKDYALNLPLVR